MTWTKSDARVLRIALACLIPIAVVIVLIGSVLVGDFTSDVEQSVTSPDGKVVATVKWVSLRVGLSNRHVRYVDVTDIPSSTHWPGGFIFGQSVCAFPGGPPVSLRWESNRKLLIQSQYPAKQGAKSHINTGGGVEIAYKTSVAAK